MVNSFKKIISPALVLVYAAWSRVSSSVPSARRSRPSSSSPSKPAQGGLVIGAVLGTMAAVAGTLAAYKFFNIQVGSRFCKWVIAAGMGFLAVTAARRGPRLLRQPPSASTASVRWVC